MFYGSRRRGRATPAGGRHLASSAPRGERGWLHGPGTIRIESGFQPGTRESVDILRGQEYEFQRVARGGDHPSSEDRQRARSQPQEGGGSTSLCSVEGA